jgi:hypothetical protein
MTSYIAVWRAISKQAVKLGYKEPMVVGKSSPFSHREDAEKWLDAICHEYHTDPAHVAEGVSCIGQIVATTIPPLVIRHCHTLVLVDNRCPKCNSLVTNRDR